MLCGPPWMCSCIGYLRDGLKSGGVMYQPWIFMPSADVYHSSLTSPSFRPARTSSFTAVSCLIVAGDFRSKLTMSPGCVKLVSVPTTKPFDEMSDTASMCVPLVTGVTLPPALKGRKYRFCEPSFCAVKYRPFPSADHRNSAGARSQSPDTSFEFEPSMFIT